MDFRKLRDKMVDDQIRGRGIVDPAILEAMRRVPRHLFVPGEFVDQAYEDCPVAIGEGQTISQPYMVAVMTERLDLTKDKSVLEIGTGSGYQTAVLAELAREIWSIERVSVLSEHARRTLESLHYSNIHFLVGDGSLGSPGAMNLFDAIMVTAAAPVCPTRLLDQLAPRGRLVIPLGDRFSQILKVYTKNNQGLQEEQVCGCRFVPLIGNGGWAA